MKKKVVYIIVLLFLIICFFISKYIWFCINEDAYFTMGRTYDGETQYINYQTKERKINDTVKFEYFIKEEYSDIKFKLPFNQEKDSIYSKFVEGALILGKLDDNDKKVLCLG